MLKLHGDVVHKQQLGPSLKACATYFEHELQVQLLVWSAGDFTKPVMHVSGLASSLGRPVPVDCLASDKSTT